MSNLMDNRRLQELMDQCWRAGIKHNDLLAKLEEEYEKRFGFNASDVDDDNFIDVFHYCTGNRMTVKQMTESAQRFMDNNEEENDDED